MRFHVFHLVKKTKKKKLTKEKFLKKSIISAFSLFDFAEMNRNNLVEGSNFNKPKVNTASGRTKVSKILSNNLINTVIGASVLFSEQFRHICVILQ